MKIRVMNTETKKTREITPAEYGDLIHGYDGTESEMLAALADGVILEDEGRNEKIFSVMA